MSNLEFNKSYQQPTQEPHQIFRNVGLEELFYFQEATGCNVSSELAPHQLKDYMPTQELIKQSLIELLELWYRTRESECLPLEVVRAHMALKAQEPVSSSKVVKQEVKWEDIFDCLQENEKLSIGSAMAIANRFNEVK